MAYIINKSDGTVLTNLEDGTLNTATSLGLIGRNYTGYGEIQNENFVFLLENFSNANPPARPIKGQAWFDSINLLFNVYNGASWIPVGAAQSSATEPSGIPGAFWHKTSTDQIFVYTGSEGWKLVGPETVEGFGKTKSESRIVKDVDGNDHAVIANVVDDIVISIVSNDVFTIQAVGEYQGYFNISRGINLRNIPATPYILSGNLKGNADTASRFETPRTINGTVYDGTNNITITASTTGNLVKGDYIVGSNFNGSASTTWSVDATSSNVIGTVVARDSSGNFSAGKIIAEEFIGLHNGNVLAASGTSNFDRIVCNTIEGAAFAGNAFSATRLQPGRNINGVLFDGTQNVTVPAASSTLTGTNLASNVVNSSLQTVGTLNSLSITDFGVTVGSTTQVRLSIESNIPTLRDINARGLRLAIQDTTQAANTASLTLTNSSDSQALGAPVGPSIIPHLSETFNLGIPNRKFNNVYANSFNGTATTARYADLAEKYTADRYYKEGIVVMFGGNQEVTLAEKSTTKVAGVISKKPAYLMNDDLEADFVAVVALQGRVPVYVTGKIQKGDMLISAGNGRAMSSKNPEIGSVIGKSLEDFDDDEGVIEMVVGRV
jgi:hypothetical protein